MPPKATIEITEQGEIDEATEDLVADDQGDDSTRFVEGDDGATATRDDLTPADKATLDPREPEAVVQAPPAEPPTPEPRRDGSELDAERRFRNLVRSAETYCQDAEEELDEAAEAHKAAKKKYDAAVDYLRRVVRDNSPGVAPLLDLVEAKATPTPAPAEPEKPAEDESWKLVPLDTLDIPKAILKKLAEFTPPITTVGQMAGLTSVPGVKLTDINGIGEAAVEKIDDALVKFWASRPKPEPKATGWSSAVAAKGPLDGPLFDPECEAMPDDTWREIELARALAKHPEIVAKLAASGFDTLGDAADHLAHDKGSIDDIPGLDPEQADILAAELDALRVKFDRTFGQVVTREMLGFEPEPEKAPKKGKGKKAARTPVAASEGHAA